ncbi:MAG: hypothetical protein Q7R33_00980 [Nitrosarchaeum sp.]|nr:hypothetical protein [Nitrosarchaeum sp.]
MGNESYIVDMRGFEAFHKTEEQRESDVSSSLYHALGENDRDRIEDIEDDKIRESIYKVFDDVIELDENIECGISDQCMAQPPIMLGWSSIEDATIEKMELLKTILEKAEFVVARLEKDRYVTYG